MRLPDLTLRQALLCGLLLGLPGWAEPPVVVRVEVSGTRRPLPLETHAGETLDTTWVAKDVRRLWATGWFEDVRVESADTPSGAELTFRVVERPRLYLRRVLFDPASEHRPLRLEPAALMDRRRAAEIAAALRRRLSEEGYAAAKVEAHLLPAGAQQVDLRLRVDAGQRYQVQQVRFRGDLGIEPSDLEHTLRATRVRRVLAWKSRPSFTEAAVEADLARLRSLYLSHGYLEAQVRPGEVQYAGTSVTVTIDVKSGPVFQVHTAGDSSVHELCRCLLDARRESEKRGEIDFRARLATEFTGPQERSAILKAAIETGPPYTVGRIEFRGHHSLGDWTLRRALALEEGAPFDPEKLRRSLVRLNRMGLFEPLTEGDSRTERDPSRRLVNVTISLTEKPRGRWSVSGPLAPLGVAGSLQGTIASRLPGWGRGALEAATYYATLSVSGPAHPLLHVLPGAPQGWFTPLAGVERPYLPGQGWQSGFFLSPQLGPQAMLAGFAMVQLRQAARKALHADSPDAPDLAVPAEGLAGPLICEAPRSGWRWARRIVDWLPL